MKRILIVAAITFGLLGFSSCDSSDTPDEPKVENDFPSQETFDKIINGNLWERNTPIISEDEDGNFVPDDFFRLYTGGGTITKLAFLDKTFEWLEIFIPVLSMGFIIFRQFKFRKI